MIYPALVEDLVRSCPLEALLPIFRSASDHEKRYHSNSMKKAPPTPLRPPLEGLGGAFFMVEFERMWTCRLGFRLGVWNLQGRSLCVASICWGTFNRWRGGGRHDGRSQLAPAFCGTMPIWVIFLCTSSKRFPRARLLTMYKLWSRQCHGKTFGLNQCLDNLAPS